VRRPVEFPPPEIGGRKLTPKQVAGLCGVAVATLRRWRESGIGPHWIELERGAVRYIESDVLDYLRRRIR
jgi:predicted site-specific integrase-resolvase